MLDYIDNDLYMLLQSVGMGDMESARIFAKGFCESNVEALSEDFSQWMIEHLEKPVMLPVPQELAHMVICEDVSQTFNPNRYWISEREESLLKEIISLANASTLLERAKMPFSNSTFIYGKPGLGKTDFARYLAYSLGLPLLYIDLCQVIGGHIGATARNLQLIFDFASKAPCVFLLDELDAIAGNRGTISNGGSGDEVTRTTLGLMQCMDQLSENVILIATTNREDMLDSGVIRRFTIQHEFKFFSPEELLSMALAYMQDIDSTGQLGLTWDANDIRSQCGINTSQSKLISLCNRAIVKAVQTDKTVRLQDIALQDRNKYRNSRH